MASTARPGETPYSDNHRTGRNNMLAFELIGLAMVVLFFGPAVTSQRVAGR